jgi:DNA-directed RNA polymerase subunit RPC12/RpoP
MVFSVAFFRHGRGLVTGSDDRTARIWDLDTGKARFVLTGHTKPVETVAISPDDKIVATAGWDGTIRLHDAETGTLSTIMRQSGGGIMSLAFSRTGEILASSAADGTVHFLEFKTRKLLNSVRQHSLCARAVVFSPDDKLLACGSEDRTATLWDVPSAKLVATLSAVDAVPTVDIDDESAPLPGSTAWFATTLMIFGLLLTLTLGVWLVARHRRRTGKLHEQVANSTSEEHGAPMTPSISFSCTGCRKNLKSTIELAGKKIKCPRCGTVALVPLVSALKGRPIS